MFNPLRREHRATPQDAVNLITLFKQKLSQVGAVLTRQASDERFFCHFLKGFHRKFEGVSIADTPSNARWKQLQHSALFLPGYQSSLFAASRLNGGAYRIAVRAEDLVLEDFSYYGVF
jgi:hypothetical protein